MRREFPELRYITTDKKGDQYEDGCPEDGIATFFYFKNNRVVEECLFVQSNDGFARMWFENMAEAFTLNLGYLCSETKNNSKHFLYSTFSVHLIYVAENGKKTAMLIYNAGGYDTGVSCKDLTTKYAE